MGDRVNGIKRGANRVLKMTRATAALALLVIASGAGMQNLFVSTAQANHGPAHDYAVEFRDEFTSGDESDSSNLPVVIVSGISASAESFGVRMSFSDADATTDYTFSSPQTITLSPGVNYNQTVFQIPNLTILDDLIAEPPKQLEFSITELSSGVEIANIDGGAFRNTKSGYGISDNDPFGVNVVLSEADTDEGGDTATVQFSLVSEPAAGQDVTIPLSLSDPTEATLNGVTEIVIANADWNNPAANEVTVTGIDDSTADGTILYQLVTGDPTSADPIYDGLTAGEVDDIDISNLDVSALPGGVGSDLYLWLKADANVFSDKSGANGELAGSTPATDGQPVESWADLSGRWTNAATSTNYAPPTFEQTDGTNFNSSLVYDGSDDGLSFFDEHINVDATKSGITTYYVLEPGFSTLVSTAYFQGRSGFGFKSFEGSSAGFGGVYNYPPASGSNSIAISGSGSEDTSAVIGSLHMDFGAVTRSRRNNVQSGFRSTNTPTKLDGTNIPQCQAPSSSCYPLSIGVNGGNFARSFSGNMSEIIMYDTANDADADAKITSYLALKYGITLGHQNATQSYVASDGTTKMWDHTLAGADTYSYDIAGVGRDDDSQLGQVKSKSSNDDGIITIEAVGEGTNQTPAFTDIADKEFLTLGNNHGDATWTATDAPDGYNILEREWQVQETGDVGTVALSIDVDDADFNVPDLLKGTKQLIVFDTDNDGLFTDETVVEEMTLNGGQWQPTTRNFTAGDTFTLATEVPLLVEFSTAAASDTESNGGNLPTLTVSGGTLDTAQSIVLDLNSPSGGTASANDYLPALPLTITIPDNVDYSSPTVIQIPGLSIGNDSIDENNEGLILTLTNPTSDIVIGDADGTDGIELVHTYTIIDDDTAGFVVTQSVGSTDVVEEGATDTFDVVLTSEPISDVIIDVISGDTAAATVNPSNLTFTSANWDTSQTVTATAAIDPDLADESVAVVLSVKDGSSDDAFDPLPNQTVTVSVVDNDIGSFVVTETAGTTTPTEEGPTDTFDVVLTAAPASDVVIDVSSADISAATIAPVSLTFTSANWDTAQTVTVTGEADADANDESVLITVVVNDASSDNDFDLAADQTVTALVTDDDSPGFTLSKATVSMSEGAGTDTFDAVLTAQPTNNVVLTVASAGTGEGTVAPATLTFTPSNWDTPKTVTVTGVDDTQTGNDTTTITIAVDDANSDDLFDPLANQTVTATFADNEAAGIIATVVDGDTSEDAGAANTARVQFTLSAQPSAGASVTIPVSLSDNTEGTLSGVLQLVIANADWNDPAANEVTISGLDDTALDGDITYQLQIGDPTSVDAAFNALDATAVAGQDITNLDDDVLSVEWASATYGSDEDAATAVPQLIVSGADTSADTTIDVLLADGSATSPADYAPLGVTELVIGADAYSTAMTIDFSDLSIASETIVEGDETLTLTLQNPGANLELGTLTNTTYTITNDDTMTYEFADAATSAPEADGNNLPMVIVSGSSEIDQTVDITAINVGATSNDDYTFNSPQELVITPGTYSGDAFVVPALSIADESIPEPDDDITFTLSNASSGLVLGAVNADGSVRNTTTYTITNDDTLDVALSATPGAENNGSPAPAVFTVTLPSVNSTGASIDFALVLSEDTAKFTDFAGAAQIISVPNGQTFASVDVAITEDGLFENNEAFTGKITTTAPGITIGIDEASAAIVDDDNGLGSNDAVLTVSNGAENNGGATTDIAITVTLTTENNTGSPLSFNLDVTSGSATEGGDFENAPVTIVIPDGAGSAMISLQIGEDSLFENDENFDVSIAPPSDPAIAIATGTVTAVIVSDDDNVTGSIQAEITATDAAAAESGADTGEFTVTLTKENNTGGPITVNFLATGLAENGVDYDTIPLSVDVPTGSDNAKITITPISDSLYELTELVVLTLDTISDPAVVPSTTLNTATVEIVNDGAAPEFGSVAMTTDNPNDQSRAKTGDTIQITFVSPVDVTNVAVTIAGLPATITGGPTNWTATLGPLVGTEPEGVAAVTIDALSTGGAPLTTSTESTNGSDVTIDYAAPAAPVVSAPADGNTKGSPTTVSGTCEADATIHISTTPAGGITPEPTTGTVDSSGAYSIEVVWAAAADGQTYDLNVECYDLAGNGPSTTVVTGILVDSSRPTATITVPASQPNPAGGSAVKYTVTFDEPIDESTLEPGDFTFTGVTSAGVTTITPKGANVYEIEVSVIGQGEISVTLNADTVTDLAGNGNDIAISTESITFDNTPPEAPVIVVGPAPNTNTGNPTSIEGFCEVGATLSITTSPFGGLNPDPTIPIANVAGAFLVDLEWVATATGNTYDILVSCTDASGNGPATTTIPNVMVDNTSPTPPLIGPVSIGDTTISGTAAPGTEIQIQGLACANAPVTASALGTWRCDNPAPAPQLGEVIAAVGVDPSGNESDPATTTVTAKDNLAPPTVNPTDGSSVVGSGEPGAEITVTDSSGTVLCTTVVRADGLYECSPLIPVPATGDAINSTQQHNGETSLPATTTVIDPATTGPLPPAINPTNGSKVTGTSDENGATVTVLDASAAVVCSATVTGGTWSCVPATPLDSGEVVTAIVTDAQGADSGPATQTVDQTSPTPPTIDPVTDADTTISGSAEPGATVAITNDGATVVCANAPITADVSGVWTCEASTPVLVAGNTIRAVATDPSGSTSDPASSIVGDQGGTDAPSVQPTDGTRVTGTADPLSQITVTDADGNIICITFTNPAGDFICEPLEPRPAVGETVDVTQTNTDTGSESAAAQVTVIDTSVTGPLPPLVNNPNDGMQIAGTGESGSTVEVRDTSGQLVCTTTVAGDGTFACELTTQQAHGSIMSVILIDANGNASDPSYTTVDTTDSDGDGIPNENENNGANNGDGNGDGIPDFRQTHVGSQISPVSNTPVTMEVSGDNCRFINGYDVISEAVNAVDDQDFEYVLGLFDYELVCTGAGHATDVTFYFDQVYDTSNWTWRKFDRNTNTYLAVSDFVTLGEATVGSLQVTTATLGVRDGGAIDEDGNVNARILDPSGPAVPIGVEELSETGSQTITMLTGGVSIVLVAGFTALLSTRTRNNRRGIVE